MFLTTRAAGPRSFTVPSVGASTRCREAGWRCSRRRRAGRTPRGGLLGHGLGDLAGLRGGRRVAGRRVRAGHGRGPGLGGAARRAGLRCRARVGGGRVLAVARAGGGGLLRCGGLGRGLLSGPALGGAVAGLVVLEEVPPRRVDELGVLLVLLEQLLDEPFIRAERSGSGVRVLLSGHFGDRPLPRRVWMEEKVPSKPRRCGRAGRSRERRSGHISRPACAPRTSVPTGGQGSVRRGPASSPRTVAAGGRGWAAAAGRWRPRRPGSRRPRSCRRGSPPPTGRSPAPARCRPCSHAR